MLYWKHWSTTFYAKRMDDVRCMRFCIYILAHPTQHDVVAHTPSTKCRYKYLECMLYKITLNFVHPIRPWQHHLWCQWYNLNDAWLNNKTNVNYVVHDETITAIIFLWLWVDLYNAIPYNLLSLIYIKNIQKPLNNWHEGFECDLDNLHRAINQITIICPWGSSTCSKYPCYGFHYCYQLIVFSLIFFVNLCKGEQRSNSRQSYMVSYYSTPHSSIKTEWVYSSIQATTSLVTLLQFQMLSSSMQRISNRKSIGLKARWQVTTF